MKNPSSLFSKISCLALLALLSFSVTPAKAEFSLIDLPAAPPVLQGPIVASNDYAPSRNTGKANIDVAFSPYGGATDLVIRAINSARKSIRVAAYSFTSQAIARALIDAKNEGVDVAVVVDHGQIRKGSRSVIRNLVSKNIQVRIDTVHTLQHNKYIIVDGTTVETGSFNYSSAAEGQNAENVLVIWNNPKLATAYADNWKDLWDKAETYK